MRLPRQTAPRYVDVDGGRLYAETAGAGRDLLLVHSGITDLRMWDGQFAHFSAHFRVTRFDMRGFGRSTAVTGPYSHVDDLARVIAALGLERPRVVAASLGGRVALDLALRSPEVIERLLLVGPAVGGARFTDTALRACWAEMSAAWEAGDVETAIELETRFWINGPGRPDGGAAPAVLARVLEMQRRIVELLPADDDDPELAEPFAALDRLGELSLPVLVVVGAHDVSDIHHNAAAIGAAVEGAEVVTLPDSGHLPNLELEAEFNRLALAFLG